jgi:hypothetical protein
MLLLLLACVMLGQAACGSGSSNLGNGGIDNSDGLPAFPPDIPQSSNQDEAVLEGIIRVVDFAPPESAAPDPGGAGGPGAPGATSGFNIMAKIINPGDDILSQTPVLPGTTYRLTVLRSQLGTANSIKAALAFSFEVNEDLDGDDIGGDTISQTIPVTLTLGTVSRVNVDISKGVPAEAGAPAPNVDPSTAPDKGELVYTFVDRDDAAASADSYFGTNYADGQTIVDADGNGFLRPGDDRVIEDGDSDGWADSSEEVFFDAANADQVFEGQVTAVDLAKYTFTMLSSGKTITVHLDPFVTIQPVAADGTLLGQVVFSSDLVGKGVNVSGFSTGTTDELLGLRVVILPSNNGR